MTDMAQEQTERFQRNMARLCEGYGRSTKIAIAAGISREHLSRLVRGKMVPGLDLAIRLAAAVDVPLTELLTTELEPAEKT